MLQTVKPRNARSKRALEKRQPQVNENPKKILYLRGEKCSQILQLALTDLRTLTSTQAIRFTKKNAIHPFEDASSLEFFSEKNDASLIVFGLHSKKRPHCVTLARTFDYRLLDMLELYVDPDSMRTMGQFKNREGKVPVGLKPMLAFSGSAFDGPAPSAYTMAKSMLLDLFKGGDAQSVDVEGLQCLVNFSVGEEVDGAAPPRIHMRVYKVLPRKSGQRVPRMEVEEIGPRIDFRIGRAREPDEAVMKEALRRPRQLEPRAKKNVETDVMGDKVGRVHVGRQDLSLLQTRKMKGLKRAREEVGGEEDMARGEDAGEDGGGDGGVPLKRAR